MDYLNPASAGFFLPSECDDAIWAGKPLQGLGVRIRQSA